MTYKQWFNIHTSWIEILEKTSNNHVFLHGATKVFEANFYQQKYSKSYLKITFCLFLKENFPKITPLNHILPIFEKNFRQNPLYNYHDWNSAIDVCHFNFQKDTAVIFLVFFLSKNVARKRLVLSILIFQKGENLQHTLHEMKKSFSVG